ncbi:MAG: hypothetical protein JNL90_03645 [Planctomycetes bacterium]|nr:hypothetical protein [Planctomycetota bacterium]
MARGASQGIEIRGGDGAEPGIELLPSALALLARLERESRDRRAALLRRRLERQAAFAAGIRPRFLPATKKLRSGAWRVAAPCSHDAPSVQLWLPPRAAASAPPPDVEALVVDHGEAIGAVIPPPPRARTLLRPRPFDRHEPRVVIDGRPVAAALLDVASDLAGRVAARAPKREPPLTVVLPPLESHLEARLWNELLRSAREELSLPAGALRALVVVDSLPALFELDELLFELELHASALLLDTVALALSTLERFGDDPTQLAPDLELLLGPQPAGDAALRLVATTARRRGVRALLGPLRPVALLRPDRAGPGLAALCERFDAAAAAGFDGVAVADAAHVELAQRRFVEAARARAAAGDAAAPLADPTGPALEEELLAAPRGERHGAALEENVAALLRFETARATGLEQVECDGRLEGRSSTALRHALLAQWSRHRARLADGRVVTPELLRELLGATADAWQPRAPPD